MNCAELSVTMRTLLGMYTWIFDDHPATSIGEKSLPIIPCRLTLRNPAILDCVYRSAKSTSVNDSIMTIGIVVHGGAGDIQSNEHAARLEAVRAALDAVFVAGLSMEDHPLLNAALRTSRPQQATGQITKERGI